MALTRVFISALTDAQDDDGEPEQSPTLEPIALDHGGPPPKWRNYEDQIYERLTERAGDASDVSFDVDLRGRFSEVDRQIDVTVRGTFSMFPHPILAVVDCKCWASNVDVTDVEALIGVVEDVGATLGLLVTTTGASAAAERRGGRSVMVEVIPYEDLAEWLDRRPVIDIPDGASHGRLKYFVGGKLVEEEIEPELARHLLRRQRIRGQRRESHAPSGPGTPRKRRRRSHTL
jgi:Restriction endonuclease